MPSEESTDCADPAAARLQTKAMSKPEALDEIDRKVNNSESSG